MNAGQRLNAGKRVSAREKTGDIMPEQTFTISHDNRTVRRGFSPKDEKQFSDESVQLLRRAAEEVRFLLNHGYPLKPVTKFVGNHYLFSERQRLALARSTASDNQLAGRKSREISLSDIEEGPRCNGFPEINVDGFNTIITLETALSGSPVFRGMDGCIRDLAGLHGTYRIIAITTAAVDLLLQKLDSLKPEQVNIYLDAPVSNSGRLKTLLYERLESLKCSFSMDVSVINDVDAVLKQSRNVVSSDSVILDSCESWINLLPEILKECDGLWMVDLSLF
ncbi:MAG: DUF434 domain-containing protein [Eubacterium sp.]